MAAQKNRFLKTRLHRAISAAIFSTGLVVSAGVSSLTFAENTVQQETREQVTVAAGNLGKTLTDIAVRHRIALSFDPALTQDLKNTAVSGNFSPLELIDALLEGTGLIMTANPDGTYSLMDQSNYTLSGLAVSAEQIDDSVLTEYKGGQIESGGRLGTFGEQDSANVPFSVVSYTNRAIEDQQLESIAEVLASDASVQSGYAYGNYAERFMVRGFLLDSDAISYGGLYGILPRQIVSTNAVESVQLLKGSSAFLNGVTPGGSGIGGAINLEPKRADEELIALTLDTTAEGQVGINTDVSRQLGDKNQWGVRVNALHREGDSAIDNETREETSINVGVDYQAEKFNVSTDVGHQKQTIDAGRSVVYAGTITEVPTAPNATTNYSPSWADSELENLFGMVKAEYELNDNWTVNAALGANKTKEDGVYASPTLSSQDGSSTVSLLAVPYESNTVSSTFGLTGDVSTGDVTHKLNLAYSGFINKYYNAYLSGDAADNNTNIYNPVDTDYPTTTTTYGDLDNPNIRNKSIMNGVSFADSLGFMDDSILLTVGFRHQQMDITEYGTDGVETSNYEQSATSPIYGIVYKASDSLSIYANHIEALQKGAIVGTGYSNTGASLKPYTSEQNEIGIKFEDGQLGASAALFDISKPEAYGETGGTYGYYGEQRNRGLELSLFGEPLTGLRINTSATWLDAKLEKAQNGTNEGNYVVGVAKYRLVLGGEYDLRTVEGLTLGGKIIRSGPQYLNASNTLEVDPWTRVDLNARYESSIAQQDVTWRLNITNLMNEGYWASAAGGYLTQGNPREIKLSLSTEF